LEAEKSFLKKYGYLIQIRFIHTIAAASLTEFSAALVIWKKSRHGSSCEGMFFIEAYLPLA
jgi:hypothetical protein